MSILDVGHIYGRDPEICSLAKQAPESLASLGPTIVTVLFGRRAFSIAKERTDDDCAPKELNKMIDDYDVMTEFRFPERGSECFQTLGDPVIFRLRSHDVPV